MVVGGGWWFVVVMKVSPAPVVQDQVHAHQKAPRERVVSPPRFFVLMRESAKGNRWERWWWWQAGASSDGKSRLDWKKQLFAEGGSLTSVLC